jgi:phage terminase small subunit
MRRGAKPMPTALKILRGNPGHTTINTDEPTPPPLAGDVPEELEGDDYARAEWLRIVPGLLACGQVTSADRALLVIYCHSYAEFRRLNEDVRDEGNVIDGTLPASS